MRKMKLSFLAMLRGWIACNIAWWMAWMVWPPELREQLMGLEVIMLMLFMALCTGVVISAACFFIFLPVDLLVPDASPLRKPGVAAFCGFLVSFALVAFFFMSLSPVRIQTDGFVEAIWNALDGVPLPYVLGTCASGTVAACTRALMDKPNRNQTS